MDEGARINSSGSQENNEVNEGGILPVKVQPDKSLMQYGNMDSARRVVTSQPGLWSSYQEKMNATVFNKFVTEPDDMEHLLKPKTPITNNRRQLNVFKSTARPESIHEPRTVPKNANVSHYLDNSAVLSYMMPAHSLQLDLHTEDDNIFGNRPPLLGLKKRNLSRGGRTDMDEQSHIGDRQPVYATRGKMNVRVRSLHSKMMFQVSVPKNRNKSRNINQNAQYSQMVGLDNSRYD